MRVETVFAPGMNWSGKPTWWHFLPVSTESRKRENPLFFDVCTAHLNYCLVFGQDNIDIQFMLLCSALSIILVIVIVQLL